MKQAGMSPDDYTNTKYYIKGLMPTIRVLSPDDYFKHDY